MAEARGAGPAPAVTGIPAAATAGGLRDTPEHWPVTRSAELARGRLLRVRRDTVTMPDGTHADRELTEHPGAVAIAALDEADRVLLIRQYRHPVGALLWEIPAGLRDVAGEPLLATAQRELLEETGYRAADWGVLTDFLTSPGSSTERVRVFLARGLTEDEEASLEVAWLPLEEAVRGFLAGDLHNGVAAVGILSAYAAVTIGFGALRDTGAPETL
jgi:8-oxo-dGTP pyrophosphatase MutT (NUDIX family)